MSNLVTAAWKYAVGKEGRLELVTLLACAAISAAGVKYLTDEFRAVAAACNDTASPDGRPMPLAGPAPGEKPTFSTHARGCEATTP